MGPSLPLAPLSFYNEVLARANALASHPTDNGLHEEEEEEEEEEQEEELTYRQYYRRHLLQLRNDPTHQAEIQQVIEEDRELSTSCTRIYG